MNAPPPRLQASLGQKDTLGCVSSQLQKDQELAVGDIRLFRKATEDSRLHQVETAATGRGILVGVSMRAGHQRRILHEYRATSHDFDAGSIYIRDFSDRYRADLRGSFDFMLLEISHASFERACEKWNGIRGGGLSPVAGVKDDVLAHLARALAPALENPAGASMLFVEQTTAAMETYLLEKYGGIPTADPRRRRILSRSQEARAKEMLRGNMGGNLSIADIALACDLSRSYFIHAFRETTGQTPHQWLSSQRLERARSLLMELERPLAEVAAECGFADQSHFTRVFTQSTGTPPGTWRRRMRVAS